MRFYITTPIYYVNDAPHIGHSYTTVVADVLARYHRLFGHEVKFLTGVDEHGQKVQNATKNGIDTQAYCDEMAKNYKAIWKELNISNDIFFRTTDSFHKKAVQVCLQELFDKGEIYSEDYEGLYCVSEEIFYTEKDLVNGKTPSGNDVIPIKEKNYFFRMSTYQQKLIEHIEKNPGFIQPEFRKNEVLGFLRKPLHDLCISRPKARLSWGIDLPFDKDYVTYVWFDALLNYATGVGYQQEERKEEFNTWWSGTRPVHLLGKDILTTHAVYWPTMLMALGIALPQTIFAHGWWLTESGEKMSKSKGPVIKPLDMKNIVGVDPLRYFLTRDIALGNDAAFSPNLVVSRINADLANNLGNLLSRVTNLIDKNFEGKMPEVKSEATETKILFENLSTLAERVKASVLKMAPQDAMQDIVDLLSEANKYIGDRAPWKQVKTDLPAAAETLYLCSEVLRVAGILLTPVMPEKCSQLLNILGWEKIPTFEDAKKMKALLPGGKVLKPEPLFMRIEKLEQ